VKPIALEIGKSIGAAIASGMWTAFKAGISNLFGPRLGARILADQDLQNFTFSGSGLTLRDGIFGGAPGFDDLLIEYGRRDLAFNDDPTRFATGGLVMGPTVGLVGEAGPEVIIPLERFERQYGSGTTINLTVNGALDAEGTARTILRTLRDAQRRTGDRLTV
jgi:hypothetical protein